MDASLNIDYSPNPEQLLKLRGLVENNSNNKMLNYTYNLKASHPATKLNLDMNGGVYYRPRWYYTSHFVVYIRSYLPLQSGEASARLDIDRNEIEFKVNTIFFYLFFQDIATKFINI